MHNEDEEPHPDRKLTRDFDEKPLPESSPESLIKQADDLCVELIGITSREAGKKDECAKRLVAAIYTLHETFRTREVIYSRFLQERGIDASNSTNEYHATAKAVMEHHGRGVKRSSIALYAQACHVMNSEGIPPEQAVQWLNEPGGRGGRGGKGRTGFGKTKQLWTDSPKGQAEIKKKISSSEANAEKQLQEEVQKSPLASTDEAASSRDNAASGTIGIALIECDEQGRWQVRQVLTKSPIRAVKALKACKSKSGDDREAAA